MVKEVLKELNGRVIANDGKTLAATIGADTGTLKHTGNFRFEGKRNGRCVSIFTEPADGDGDAIRILSVAAEDNALRNAIRKVHITYKMLRGENESEVAETCIDLPISAERYEELARGVTPANKAWGEIRDALVTLTRLQSYDTLGAWSVEVEMQNSRRDL